MKCTKLVMDEMYKICKFSANFEDKYSRICLVSVVNLVLVLKPTLMSLFLLFGLCLHVRLFDMYESSYAIIQKIGLHSCSCGMNKNILNFVLSSLYQICMKFLIPSVIKLGYKLCKNKKIKIFLLPIKVVCVVSVVQCQSQIFCLRYGQRIWVVWVVLNKSVDAFGCVINTENS